MAHLRLALLLTAIAASRTLALDVATARMVDLTHAFDEQTIYWPTARSFTMWPVAHGHTPGGWWYAANDFCAAEHGGTHLDAPIHFAEQGATADAVPLSRLRGPAVVVDVSERAATDPDTLLEVADLERAGEIGAGDVVLVRTGWDRWWSDRAKYLGTATPGDTAHLHFPGIAPAAAEWLVARKVNAVGIDTASIDRGQSTDFRSHQVFGRANVPTLENLAGLDALPARGAVFLGLPMKIRGGSGAPLRAVAFLP
jgi:kynurenine formamidase